MIVGNQQNDVGTLSRDLLRLCERAHCTDPKAFHSKQHSRCITNTVVIFHQQDMSLPGLLRGYRRALPNAGRHCGRLSHAYWKHEGESRPLARLRTNVKTKLEQLDQSLHDAQPQSVAISCAIGRNTDLVELIVEVRKLLRRDTDSRVRDFDPRFRIAVHHAVEDDPTSARVFDGGGQQIAQDLLYE